MGEKPTEVDAEEARKSGGEQQDRREAQTSQASGIAVSEAGVGPDRPRTARMAAGDVDADGPPEPAEATNLNSSRSNIYRQAPPGEEPGGPPDPAEATNLNSSRSNIYRTQAPAAGAPDEPPEPAEATNLNSSKSNIYREAGPGDEGSPDESESDSESGSSAGGRQNETSGGQGRIYQRNETDLNL